MGELKPPKFRKGDVIIRNFHNSHGLTLDTVSVSDKIGSYVGIDDKPGETTYTVEFVQKRTYGGEIDSQFHHYCYKLKEAKYMFIHDSRIVDIEFDLYSEYMRGLKIKKILNEIQSR